MNVNVKKILLSQTKKCITVKNCINIEISVNKMFMWSSFSFWVFLVKFCPIP